MIIYPLKGSRYKTRIDKELRMLDPRGVGPQNLYVEDPSKDFINDLRYFNAQGPTVARPRLGRGKKPSKVNYTAIAIVGASLALIGAGYLIFRKRGKK